MSQHLVIVHGTDKVGGHWYAPFFVDASDTTTAKSEIEQGLVALRTANDPRGDGVIGFVCAIPVAKPGVPVTAAGEAALAAIKAYGQPPSWKVPA